VSNRTPLFFSLSKLSTEDVQQTKKEKKKRSKKQIALRLDETGANSGEGVKSLFVVGHLASSTTFKNVKKFLSIRIFLLSS
jgi:hypothetical protein